MTVPNRNLDREVVFDMTCAQMGINSTGAVTITSKGIVVEGFNFNNATCREGAIMAAAWAIGELQREMLKTIQTPGGGNICIG